jgi:hypothetical protein
MLNFVPLGRPILVVAGIAIWLPSGQQSAATPREIPAAKKVANRKSPATKKNPARDETTPRPIDSSTYHLLVVRDPAVQQELKLAPEQVKRVERAVAESDRPLFALRDVKESASREKVASLLAQLAAQLTQILDQRQQQRLREIVVQAQGTAALVTATVADELELSAQQIGRIEKLLADTKRASNALAERAAKGEQVPANKSAEIQAAGQKKIVAILLPQQQLRFAALAGDRFDLSRLRPLAYKAPELQVIEHWLNSEPLTLEQLRGKVVVLNFFAYG